MNRYEFIEKLRVALSGKATQSAINENVRYYEEYLDAEIRKGRSEEEVIRTLGDPRLLAKTIVEANRQAGTKGNAEEVYGDTVDYSSKEEKKRTILNINGKMFPVSKWAIIAAIIVIILLVFVLVGTVIRIILPIVIPIVLISMAIKIVTVLLHKD